MEYSSGIEFRLGFAYGTDAGACAAVKTSFGQITSLGGGYLTFKANVNIVPVDGQTDPLLFLSQSMELLRLLRR